jgi:hypothetical protein
MIGIIGQGFVGNTIRVVFDPYYKIETYDKFLSDRSTCKSLPDLCSKCNIVFVCVPTPMNYDGSCNIDIVTSILNEINNLKLSNIVIIKSTVLPNTTKNYNNRYQNISIVFNPEFLTEKNAIHDFKNQTRVILGGKIESLKKIETVYRKIFPNADIILTNSTIAEMVKYTTNIFLATKVSFANEIKMLCDKLDIDYSELIRYTRLDKRIGQSHLNVPGHDGELGFGGSCFPKDISALISLSKSLNVPLHTITGAWQTNLIVRPEKDWFALKNRAVVDMDMSKLSVIIGKCDDGFIDRLKVDNTVIILINNQNIRHKKKVQHIKGEISDIELLLSNLSKAPDQVFYFETPSKDTLNFEETKRFIDNSIKSIQSVIEYCYKYDRKLIYRNVSSDTSLDTWIKKTNIDLIKNYGETFGLKFDISLI